MPIRSPLQHVKRQSVNWRSQAFIRLHPSRGRSSLSAARTDDDVDKTMLVGEGVFSEMFNGF